MTYQEAKELKENSLHFLNTKTENGAYITEILIVPSDAQKREDFFKLFFSSDNADFAIQRYLNDDLVVWAIDGIHLKKAGVLFYKEL